MTRHRVSTRSGLVEGSLENGIEVFRGIPFAKEPSGTLRFALPQPRSPWNGVFDATRRAPAAPHVASTIGELIGLTDDFQSEDCLHVTIWKPPGKITGRPVMVWIHGGAFETGSSNNPIASGAAFARGHGIVVVSLQYRIGISGFLPIDGAPQNRGLLDLLMGLEWTANEIESFGGDPNNITLFGSSAGGVLIAALLAIPAAKGLFQRVIIQSGNLDCIGTSEAMTAVARAVATQLGLSDASSPELRRRLENLSTSELLAVQNAVSLAMEAMTGGLVFTPLFGAAPFGTSHPLTTIAGGEGLHVPMLIGTNKDEMKLLKLRSMPFLPKPRRPRDLPDALTTLLGNDWRLGDDALELYSKLPRVQKAGAVPDEIVDAVSTDLHFRAPALRLADAHARNVGRTYGYMLSWPVPQFGPVFGSPHTMEIPLVFRTHHVPPLPIFLGARPSLAAMSEKMHDAWAAFAKSGDPSTDATGSWPRYSPTDRRILVFDDPIHEEANYMQEEMLFWRKALGKLRPLGDATAHV